MCLDVKLNSVGYSYLSFIKQETVTGNLPIHKFDMANIVCKRRHQTQCLIYKSGNQYKILSKHSKINTITNQMISYYLRSD